MKIDPSDGSEIWTDINPNSEYSIEILVESSDGYIYFRYRMGRRFQYN